MNRLLFMHRATRSRPGAVGELLGRPLVTPRSPLAIASLGWLARAP